MSWIRVIGYEEASGRLRQLYDRVKGPGGELDNILQVHSLRPHTLEGHMTLYKYVLHHPGNALPKWLLEMIGVYTSHLNGCEYCVAHHYTGLRRLLADDERADAIRAALIGDRPEDAFAGRDLAFLRYARVLALTPREVTEAMVADLGAAGADDGEILEVNQVVSYFCYVNRTVLGLGVTTAGDILGLSPGDDTNPENWGHA